jgi:hypothetical protein
MAALFAGADIDLSTHVAAIMWSPDGWIEDRGRVRKPLPAEYVLGAIEKSKLSRFKTVIPDTTFGSVVFDPKPADARSSRRLIDFDGKDIVVR